MGKKVGKIVKAVVKSAASVATLGLSDAVGKDGNFLKNMATGYAGAVTGYDKAKTTTEVVGSVVGDLTGATAAQEQLNQQVTQSKADSRRQALLSDAMAQNEGGESARVSLNTAKNRRKAGSSATGISGASSSNTTGIQS